MEKRGSDHKRVQKEGKKRDLSTCQVCGSRIKVEGHHIFDYVFGGAAHKENIISLCHECHKNVHNGRIELFKF